MPAMRKGAVQLQHRKKIKVKNAHAVALGARGGKKGGPARAAALNPEERTAIARMGGYARSKGT